MPDFLQKFLFGVLLIVIWKLIRQYNEKNSFRRFYEKCRFLIEICEKNLGCKCFYFKVTRDGQDYLYIRPENMDNIVLCGSLDSIKKLKGLSEYAVWMAVKDCFQ